jgi:two-component system cell cycle sensor histidine kinase PleC
MGEYSLRLGEAILRTRTREAENTARLESEIANRIKSEFISNMSHELRTPLNTVIGFSKLLAEHDRRPLGEADVVEYARLINDAAGNLLSIINDILDISKIQSGHYHLKTTEIALDEVVEAVVLASRSMADTAGVTLQLDLDSAELVVRGDALKLKQVLGNLIGNAIKFTDPGGIVTISAMADSDGGVSVTVNDTGVGMEAAEVEVALAPFGQVDGTRTRWREGTGLGLPIARALVELHGGQLTIESTKGVGSKVCVRFPPPNFVAFMQQQDLGFQFARP